ncbi:MAG: hypothetical protein DHS20C01_02370 [marine bacterium B5-7]|nr:MAG: hypothetical protein DHS20C01_02370 [marine bacterium B5-7]
MFKTYVHVFFVLAISLITYSPDTFAQTSTDTNTTTLNENGAWRGVIDANIPFDFHANIFNQTTIEGQLRLGSARFGFANADALCKKAMLKANGDGQQYTYEITGNCGGKGTLKLTNGATMKLTGKGTLYDRSSPSAHKRRTFYMSPVNPK